MPLVALLLYCVTWRVASVWRAWAVCPARHGVRCNACRVAQVAPVRITRGCVARVSRVELGRVPRMGIRAWTCGWLWVAAAWCLCDTSGVSGEPTRPCRISRVVFRLVVLCGEEFA